MIMGEQPDIEPGNPKPKASLPYGRNLPAEESRREHQARTVPEANQLHADIQTPHMQEQRKQSVPREMLPQNLPGFRETELTNAEAGSSAGKPQSTSSSLKEKQVSSHSASSEKIGEAERRELAWRADAVVKTKGRVLFTPRERETIRKALGPGSISWSDLKLAAAFLQAKDSSGG